MFRHEFRLNFSHLKWCNICFVFQSHKRWKNRVYLCFTYGFLNTNFVHLCFGESHVKWWIGEMFSPFFFLLFHYFISLFWWLYSSQKVVKNRLRQTLRIFLIGKKKHFVFTLFFRLIFIIYMRGKCIYRVHGISAGVWYLRIYNT